MTKFNNGDVTDALDSFFIDYTIRGESSESIIRDLEQQHSEMNSAVNEWYSKAKAFDEINSALKEVLSDVKERGIKLPADVEKFSLLTERVIRKYESGEPNA